jgi:uncharacterized protein DUF4325
MTALREDVNIASEFSVTPGSRKRSEADFSGQQFLEDLLRPRFVAARKNGAILHVNLDGAAGYPTSFLEEAFGGLAREFGSSKVLASLEIVCNDEPYLLDDILRYIRDAAGRP